MPTHVPVLLHEAITELSPRPGETIVDATLGGGGHSAKICEAVGPHGTLLAFDADPDAFPRSEAALKEFPCRKVFIHGNFREMDQLLREKGITQVGGILFDLGISSFHLEVSGRGFSFRKKEPLLMTLGKDTTRTAYEIVNHWGEEELTKIFREYGEEQFARPIAQSIIAARKAGPIGESDALAEIIYHAVPRWYRARKIHPATKTFQALRIATNEEMDALEEGLQAGWNILKPGGRMAVISFHSLEDRIVKNFFKEKCAEGGGELVNKKPTPPGRREQEENPRSRSAKLRTIEKILHP